MEGGITEKIVKISSVVTWALARVIKRRHASMEIKSRLHNSILVATLTYITLPRNLCHSTSEAYFLTHSGSSISQKILEKGATQLIAALLCSGASGHHFCASSLLTLAAESHCNVNCWYGPVVLKLRVVTWMRVTRVFLRVT